MNVGNIVGVTLLWNIYSPSCEVPKYDQSFVMETLEEFDRECPLVKTFCNLLSEEEFEQQTSCCTEQALQDLFKSMEENPTLYEKVIRRRKQEELERAGLKSLIKAKLFSAFEGDLNQCNAVTAAELRLRVNQLREDMKKVQTYAKEAKSGATRTARLIEKKQNTQKSTGTVHQNSASQACVPPAPPPPPPPPPPPLPVHSAQIFTPLRDKTNFQQADVSIYETPDALECSELPKQNQRSMSLYNLQVESPSVACRGDPMLSIQSEILSMEPKSRLRATGMSRSPGGTPLQTPKKVKQNDIEVSSPRTSFNIALLNKFQSIRSSVDGVKDSPTNSDTDSSGFATPTGTP